MSAENVAVVRSGYEALASGDVEGFLATLDAQIEWIHPAGLPYGGIHRGLAGMREVLGLWGETYEEMQVMPEEFLDAGDSVVVVGRYVVRPRGEETLETWFVNIFDLAGGKVTRFRDYSDKAVRLAPVFGATAG
jgi:ketosteroid isomerase-like protein